MATKPLALALATCLLAASGFAADTAAVIGRVTDSSGGVLPGALVTAHNVNTGLARTHAAESDGGYRVPALPPGDYEFTVALAGFATARRTGVSLSLGSEARLDFELAVDAFGEEVTIVADAPVVDATNASVQWLVTREELDLLAITGRDYIFLSRLVPGLTGTAGEGGGSFAGARGRSNQYLIDGVDNSDDTTGFRRQGSNLEAVEEYQVLMNNYKAEYGRASGAVINALSRSGTNRYHGSAFFFFRDQAMNARDPFLATNEPEDPFRRMQWGAAVGGPVVRERTHFYLSYEHEHTMTSSVITAPFPSPGATVSPAVQQFLDENRVPPFPDTSAGTRVRLVRPEWVKTPRVTARLDHQVSGTQTLTFRFNYDRPRNSSGVGGTIYDANGSTNSLRNAYGSLAHKWIRSSTQVNEAYLQIGQSKFGAFVHRPDLTNVFVDEFSSGTPYLGGTTTFPQGREDWVFQFIDNYTIHRPGWGGDHVFKIGGDVKLFRSTSFFDSNFRGSYSFRTVSDFLAGRPTRFTANQGDSTLDSPSNTYGFYVQDDWRVHPRLTLNVGLRYDYENGKTEALRDVPEGSPVCAVTGSCGEPGPGISGDRNNVAPRFGFVWDVFGNQKTALHGGTGIYFDQIVLNVQGNARFTPPKVIGVQIDNPAFPDPFTGGTLVTLRPNLSVIDPALRTPQNFNSSIGVRQALTADIGLDATFVWNKGSDHVVVLNTNAIDPVTMQRPNPSFTNVGFHTNEGEIRYRALWLGLRRRMAKGYSWSIAYTLAGVENTSETIFSGIQDPRDIARSFGPGDDDRRHTLEAAFVGRLPLGFDLGAIIEYRSARPINVFAGGRDLNGDGITGDWPDGYSRNQRNGRTLYELPLEEANRLRQLFGLSPIERFDDNDEYYDLDLTVRKRFGLGGSKVLKITAELYNVFNTQNNATPTSSITSALFGQVTQLDIPRGARPRALKLTAQVDF